MRVPEAEFSESENKNSHYEQEFSKAGTVSWDSISPPSFRLCGSRGVFSRRILSLHPSSQPSFLSDPGKLPPTESEEAAFSWGSLPSCPLFPALGFASLLFRAQPLIQACWLLSQSPWPWSLLSRPTPHQKLPLHSDAHSQIAATTSSLDCLTVVLPSRSIDAHSSLGPTSSLWFQTFHTLLLSVASHWHSSTWLSSPSDTVPLKFHFLQLSHHTSSARGGQHPTRLPIITPRSHLLILPHLPAAMITFLLSSSLPNSTHIEKPKLSVNFITSLSYLLSDRKNS